MDPRKRLQQARKRARAVAENLARDKSDVRKLEGRINAAERRRDAARVEMRNAEIEIGRLAPLLRDAQKRFGDHRRQAKQLARSAKELARRVEREKRR